MSVFRGSITEYPGVIVDHFIPFNCERGRAFFLSHCHKDHMTGLGSPAIVNALNRRNACLHCSEVTRSLLLKDPGFTHLTPFLKGLPMEEPIAMTLEAFTDSKTDEGKGILQAIKAWALTFTVTLLPAGHCPGSAMFFFQGDGGNVLYTGDFRLTQEETKRLRVLHCGGRVLDIATLYVDTTFCHPIANEIPSREVSRDHILKFTESWLSQSPMNAVHLQCSMFGYEHIFMGVARKFNTKVHIAAWRLNAYSGLSAVAECLTTDGSSTRIHACNFRKGTKKHSGLPCGSCTKNGQPLNVLRIKPSTQWFLFTNKTITEPYIYIPEYNGYRVIHSMHASYSEVCDFVSYLRPKRVVPCVVPSGDRTLTDVHSRLKALLPHSEIISTTSETHSKQASHSRVATLKRKETAPASSESESDSDWSDGDGTIDEFVSSEEQPHLKARTFSALSSSHAVNLSLPSLLRYSKQTESVPPSSSSSETSVSGSGTFGSLQQTPIDLSSDSPGEVLKSEYETDSLVSDDQLTSITTSTTINEAGEIEYERDATINEAREIEDEQDATINEAGEIEYERDATINEAREIEDEHDATINEAREIEDEQDATINEAGEIGYEQDATTNEAARLGSTADSLESTADITTKEEEEDWCLILDLSTDERSPSGDDPGRTPCRKRRKLESSSTNNPAMGNCTPKAGRKKLRNRYPPQPRGSHDSEDDDSLERTKDYRDHQLYDSVNSPQSSVTKRSSASLNLKTGMEPDVIILSDSKRRSTSTGPESDVESDQSVLPGGLGSPLCLPPTPGREGVESILQRKSIAFS